MLAFQILLLLFLPCQKSSSSFCVVLHCLEKLRRPLGRGTVPAETLSAWLDKHPSLGSCPSLLRGHELEAQSGAATG